VPTLRLRFLGPLDIRYGDQPLPKPPTLKSQSLLAYLILHRHHPQPRDRMVGLFWGDRPERKARASLSTALWHIRRCLPHETLILSDSHTVQFDPQSDLWLDVEEFERLADSRWPMADGSPNQEAISHLQSAISLYRGDFLDGFYDDWIINERYRLEALFLEALARLMIGHEARGEHDAALVTALRLLGHDPLREDAHRAAMRAYCRLGQRNAALEQYHRCREVVLEELGVEPMVETTELYQAILEGRFEVGRVPPIQIPAVEPSVPLGRSPLDVVTPVKLVGRGQEMAFLRDCWQRAQAEQGGLVLISGEAGVGKTRLVEEFANRLRWQGVRVLWGRCYEFERAMPYQPIAEALRTVLPTLTPSELAAIPGGSLAEVARLVPEVAEVQPGLEGSPEPDQEQARLCDGVTRFLAALSSHGALLIVLEDLHWASESTLQLLHYLARHLADHPVIIAGTFRPEAIGLEHALLDLRRRLAREGLAKPLRLSRLSPAAVETMVVEMSGAGDAVLPLAKRLYQETEGHPFFLMEIIKALFETEVIHLEESAWQGDFARISEGELPLPASVSEAIQARAHRLDEDTQEALRLAAVLGREFDFELLNAVWGRGEEATLEALDDLLRHRLIDEGTGPLDRDYTFTHHKIQEVVYAGMPRRRREHAHARVGAAMETLYGSQVEELAGELAFHFEQGRQLDKRRTEKAITYLLLAGDRARTLYAHQEAIVHYQQALALLKDQGKYEWAARTLMKLGLTYHNAFDFRRARQAYQESFALWQRGGKVEVAIPPPPAPHALRVFWLNMPTLDPTMTNSAASVAVISQLFSGLVERGPELEVIPDLARSWEVLEGGRKYVFHLRDDVRWSDGIPVTAGDVEYAWKRTLDPSSGSPNASLLYDVAGAKAFHRGEEVGVRAADRVTLVVELEEPTGYFLQLLGHHVTFPVPRHVVEAHGGSWTELGNLVTNGPFRLESWQPGDSMTLVHNPDYHGQFTGNTQRVELTLLPLKKWPAILDMYEADELDVLLRLWYLPPTAMDRVRRQYAGEYVLAGALHTGYVGFDTRRPPFDDPRVRRAFVLAVDRETLADVIVQHDWFPATGGFVPPGMPGHSPGIALPYDPEGARRLLAEAGYPGGRGFPVVNARTFHGVEAIVEYMQMQWWENLGVEIPCEAVRFDESADELHVKTPPLSITAWQADYPDPDNFLRVGLQSAGTGWRCEAYDELVEEARRVMDQGERMKLYGQAERILVEEAPIMPFVHARWGLLVKPWVRRYPVSPMRQWFWKDVIIEPH
jgi:ABC-type oligopeptide transport system substrate-binding subunit/DNA-binding SARP family transcriptional activator